MANIFQASKPAEGAWHELIFNLLHEANSEEVHGTVNCGMGVVQAILVIIVHRLGGGRKG